MKGPGAAVCAFAIEARESSARPPSVRTVENKTRLRENHHFFISCLYVAVKTTTYLSTASILTSPALAQTASFSPPGAPETPTMPEICRMKAFAGSSNIFMVWSEVWLRVRAV